MQIVINRQDLLSVLKRSGAAVTAKDMVSVRQCVLFDAAEGSSITCAATNGQTDIIVATKGEVKRPGRAALNHSRLSSLINELPDGYVEITVDDKYRVTIRSSASKRKFSMTALDPSDFPPVLSVPLPPPLYSVEAKILLQAASEVAFAIDVAAMLAPGALLSPGEGKLFELTAVDGRVFAMAKGWFTERGSTESCLLPKTLLDAMRGIPKDQVVSIAKDQSRLFVVGPDMRIHSAQIQQPFPVMLKEQLLKSVPEKRRFRVSSETFLESVRAVSAASEFVEGTDKFVQIDMSYSDGVVKLATRKSEKEQGEDEFSVSEADPGSFKIHFNATMMALALKSFAPTEIDFYYAIVCDRPSSFIQSETLLAMVMLIDEIASPPPKGSK